MDYCVTYGPGVYAGVYEIDKLDRFCMPTFQQNVEDFVKKYDGYYRGMKLKVNSGDSISNDGRIRLSIDGLEHYLSFCVHKKEQYPLNYKTFKTSAGTFDLPVEEVDMLREFFPDAEVYLNDNYSPKTVGELTERENAFKEFEEKYGFPPATKKYMEDCIQKWKSMALHE